MLPGVLVLVGLVTLWRRPSAALPLAALGGACALVVDAKGAPDSGSLGARLWGSAATGVVSLAWWYGAMREAVAPSW